MPYYLKIVLFLECQDTKRCQTCSASDLTACTTCASDKLTGTCDYLPFLAYIENCLTSDNSVHPAGGDCALCDDGYYRNDGGQCSSCRVEKCLKCNGVITQQCERCQQRYDLGPSEADGKRSCRGKVVCLT